MSSLPDELKGHYSSSLLYNASTLRFGVNTTANGEAHLYERKANRKILSGKVKLLQLQNAYAQSYLSTNDPKLIHVRDLLISLALTWTNRSVQYKDISATDLTQHSKQFWESPHSLLYLEEYDALQLMNNSNEIMSTIGSLGYSVLSQNSLEESEYPITLLNKILTWFWTDLGYSFYDPPAQRHLALINKVLKPVLPFGLISSALNKIYTTSVNSQPIIYRDTLAYIRQQLLTSSDWDGLKQRFLLSEYSPTLLGAIKKLQLASNSSEQARVYIGGLPIADINSIYTLSESLIKFLPPVGFLLIYTSFAVEGLYRAAQRLNKINDDLATMSFSVFIKTNVELELKQELARDLALAYDAFAALSYFGSIKDTKEMSYKCYELATQLLTTTQVELPETGDTRLSDFIS